MEILITVIQESLADAKVSAREPFGTKTPSEEIYSKSTQETF